MTTDNLNDNLTDKLTDNLTDNVVPRGHCGCVNSSNLWWYLTPQWKILATLKEICKQDLSVHLFMFQNMQWGDALHIAVMVMYKFNSYS